MNHRLAAGLVVTATLAALPLGLHAQQATAPMSLQEQNKAVVRGYLDEVANGGRLDRLGHWFAPDVVFNGSRDAERPFARLQALRRAFPDHHLTIEDQIAEGDRVVTRVTFRGTHLGPFNGIAPTGRAVVYAGTAIDRLEGGKVVEMWHVSNQLHLLQQIGAVPLP